MEVNGINIDAYKTHPRLLELRVMLIYQALINEYDINVASNLFRALANTLRIDWTKLNAIISNHFKIRRLEVIDKKRYRQEVILMGMLYGETRYYIAERYLNLNRTTVYRSSYQLQPEAFISQEWLDELDSNVTICGVPVYRFEAERFVNALSNFLEVLGYVFVSK